MLLAYKTHFNHLKVWVRIEDIAFSSLDVTKSDTLVRYNETQLN